MESSQKVISAMNDQDSEDVRAALKAVQATSKACQSVAPAGERAKLADAEQRLIQQLEGLAARSVPKKRPQLSEAELASLEKKGDPGCPRGQQYEHAQNQAMIRCVGPQLVEMNWDEALDHFVERRQYSARQEGAHLKLERGSQVFHFAFSTPHARDPATCLTVVGAPGISWQELVARATGVQPRRLKLGRAVPTKQGPLPLLVEGDEGQFSVKLGKCEPTPGQKPYSGPAE